MKNKTFKRGEIWIANLDQTIGDEIKKKRPVIILNRQLPVGLDLCIVVPVTSWKPEFDRISWLVKIEPDSNNCLDSISIANSFQIRTISTHRLIIKLGTINDETLFEIAESVAFCVGA